MKGEGKKKKKSFKGEWGHVHACKATRYIEMVHSQIFVQFIHLTLLPLGNSGDLCKIK